jgi:hypothetical protein
MQRVIIDQTSLEKSSVGTKALKIQITKFYQFRLAGWDDW